MYFKAHFLKDLYIAFTELPNEPADGGHHQCLHASTPSLFRLHTEPNLPFCYLYFRTLPTFRQDAILLNQILPFLQNKRRALPKERKRPVKSLFLCADLNT